MRLMGGTPMLLPGNRNAPILDVHHLVPVRLGVLGVLCKFPGTGELDGAERLVSHDQPGISVSQPMVTSQW